MQASESIPPAPTRARTALVLSGGGARGAYEAGLVAGIVEALKDRKQARCPFDIFCGTSVGALNAAYLAAHAHLPDMAVSGMIESWQSLELGKHLKIDLRGLLGWKRDWSKLTIANPNSARARRLGRSLLDPRALDELARSRVPWDRLHHNIGRGVVRALICAALQVGSGRTTIFAELAPNAHLPASRDPRRETRKGAIGPDHILASAAIPVFFPARRIGEDFYCDGGIRFNTPLAPAIRAGAERLVVVSLLSPTRPGARPEDAERAFPSPLFLIGKVLNALLLDPINYDLHVLERFNILLETLEETVGADKLEEVQHVVRGHRGLTYRRLDTLVFHPSEDIGHLACEVETQILTDRFSSWLLAHAAALGSVWESDLLSFILFDGEFAKRLIELGRKDALARRDEIVRFFSELQPLDGPAGNGRPPA
ncbi:MAG: patatin-like phospholipase family protein [Proteobacteria bacterium]|nr:patatin-like phospholipase family protein [Pseudomonadota bacterium]